MDLQLYARVLWRFKVIILLGLVLALTLALLSAVRVGSQGFKYRSDELWSSTTRLRVTQSGFPEGRLYGQEPTTLGEEPGIAPPSTSQRDFPVVDPARFNFLAIYYAELATSDPVRRLIRQAGPPIRGQVIATSLRDDQSGTLLPLIDLAAISTSPQGAMMLAQRGAGALKAYLASQQRTNKVPQADRVVLRTIVQPRGARIFQPRSKTMPIVVFLVVMFAFVGLAFLLESIKPQPPKANEPQKPDLADKAVQARSA
jgi:hypothetical protein